MMLSFFKRRLPPFTDLYAVFGAVVFFVHSWSIRGFLYKLPSFLFYLSPWDILSVFSYMMAFALVEAILVMMGLVLLSVIFPGKWFRDGFVYKGFLVLLVATIAAVLLQKTMGNTLPDTDILYQGAGLAVLITVCLILLFHNVHSLQRIVFFFIDGFGVMAYFYVPIGMISLLVVILRNLS